MNQADDEGHELSYQVSFQLEDSIPLRQILFCIQEKDSLLLSWQFSRQSVSWNGRAQCLVRQVCIYVIKLKIFLGTTYYVSKYLIIIESNISSTPPFVLFANKGEIEITRDADTVLNSRSCSFSMLFTSSFAGFLALLEGESELERCCFRLLEVDIGYITSCLIV